MEIVVLEKKKKTMNLKPNQQKVCKVKHSEQQY